MKHLTRRQRVRDEQCARRGQVKGIRISGERIGIVTGSRTGASDARESRAYRDHQPIERRLGRRYDDVVALSPACEVEPSTKGDR